MTGDFRAKQIQANKLIVTGSFADQVNNQLLIYNYAAQSTGTSNQGVIDATKFSTSSIGTDVFLFVSGGVGKRGVANSNAISVFGGDTHISGNLTVGGTSPGGGGSGPEYWISTSANQIFATSSLVSITGSFQSSFLSSSNGATITGTLRNGNTGCVASGLFSHAEGFSTTASGDRSHAEGSLTVASNTNAHAEGDSTTASGDTSHSEGLNTDALGNYSHAEGDDTNTSNNAAHAEGQQTSASGIGSHAEGIITAAASDYSHTEGELTTAVGRGSHAEGYNTSAIFDGSHAEGIDSSSEGYYSHAEGFGSITSGLMSHAEGDHTEAIGQTSHAEGSGSISYGLSSHAGGIFTIASGTGQTTVGKFNLRNNDFSLFIIGDGTADIDASRGDILRANSGSAIGTGRVEVTGTLAATQGISGSLTKLANGTSYLIAGSGASIASQSNGAITISSVVRSSKQYIAPKTTTNSTTALVAGQFSWVPSDFTGLSSVVVRSILSTDGTANHTGSLQIFNLTSGSFLDIIDTPSTKKFFDITGSAPTLVTSSNLLVGNTNFNNIATSVYEVRISGSTANNITLGGIELVFS